MNVFIHIYVMGFAILVGALLLNVIATKLGIMTWYGFIEDRSSVRIIDYLWLFAIYPLLLGTVAYLAYLFGPNLK